MNTNPAHMHINNTTTSIFTPAVVLLGVLLCLSPLGTVAQPYHQVQVQPQPEVPIDPLIIKEYFVGEYGKINVFTPVGDIEVVSVRGSKRIRVELYAERGFSFWPGGDILENYRVINLKRGNEITASVEQKSKQKSSFWSSQTRFSYKIEVPENVSTNIKTLSGNVTLKNVRGKQMLRASSGNIELHNIIGHLEAFTSAGSIGIEECVGTIFARADGGNINIRETTGELRLKIHGGKVTSSGISGSMIAVVNGGDINAQFKNVGKVINLQTNAGSINLAVPESEGYGLFARGSSVLLDQGGFFEGTQASNSAEGSINGGGSPISLTANAGTVTLRLNQ